MSIDSKNKSTRRSKHIPHHLRPKNIVERRNRRERLRVQDIPKCLFSCFCGNKRKSTGHSHGDTIVSSSTAPQPSYNSQRNHITNELRSPQFCPVRSRQISSSFVLDHSDFRMNRQCIHRNTGRYPNNLTDVNYAREQESSDYFSDSDTYEQGRYAQPTR